MHATDWTKGRSDERKNEHTIDGPRSNGKELPNRNLKGRKDGRKAEQITKRSSEGKRGHQTITSRHHHHQHQHRRRRRRQHTTTQRHNDSSSTNSSSSSTNTTRRLHSQFVLTAKRTNERTNTHKQTNKQTFDNNDNTATLRRLD